MRVGSIYTEKRIKMTYTIEVIRKALNLSGLSQPEINYAISLLPDAHDIIHPKHTCLDELLIELCRIEKMDIEVIRSPKKDGPLVNFRVAFVEIAKREFPEIRLKYIAKEINRDRATVAYHYAGLIKNDRVIRTYCKELSLKLRCNESVLS